MSKTVKRKARHRKVSVFVIFRGHFYHGHSTRAYVSAEDARQAARDKIAAMCKKLGIAKTYYNYEVFTLPLESAKLLDKKITAGPY